MRFYVWIDDEGSNTFLSYSMYLRPSENVLPVL